MKRKVKKYLSFFMAFVIAFLTLQSGLVASAAGSQVKTATISDLNVKANAADADGMLLSKSEALLDKAIEEILSSDAQVVLVTGDLTKDGTRASHNLVAAKLKALLTAGKKVYVVPGENDVRESGVNTGAISKADFALIYGEFGFDAATVRDAETLSYVAEPVQGYQFLMLDTVANASGMSKDHFGKGSINADWAVTQIKNAKASGNMIIGAAHHPGISRGSVEATLISLLQMVADLKDANGDPLYTGNPMDGLSLVDKSAFSYSDMQSMANAGLEYIFTGHAHMVDIASSETAEGNTWYDIGTGSLVTASSSVRYGVISPGMAQFTTKAITEVGGQAVQTLARQAIENNVLNLVDSAVATALPAVYRVLDIFQPILKNLIEGMDFGDALPSSLQPLLKTAIKGLIDDEFSILKNPDILEPVIEEIKQGLLATEVDGVPLSKIIADIIISKQLGDETVPDSLKKLVNALREKDSDFVAGIIRSFADNFKAEKTVSMLNQMVDQELKISIGLVIKISVRSLLAGPVSIAGQTIDLWSILDGLAPDMNLSETIRPLVNALVLGADNSDSVKQTPARFKANLKEKAPDIAELLLSIEGLADTLENALKDTGPTDNSFTVTNFNVSDVEDLIRTFDPKNLKASQYPKVVELITAFEALPPQAIGEMDEQLKLNYDEIVSQKDALQLAYAAYEAIAVIGDVTYDRFAVVKESLDAATAAVEKAEAKYIDNLDVYSTAKEQFETLSAVKSQVDAVIQKIDALGEVTLNSKQAIEEAEAAYNALGDAKTHVTNADKLADARAAYDALAADAAAVKDAIEKIDAIGTVTVTEECLKKIEAAEAAYNALRADLKTKVTNSDVLAAARERYNQLIGVQGDALIAIRKISAIGTVTLESEIAIRSAEAAYAKLTDDQKAMVHNYQLLLNARAEYDQLVLDHAAVQAVMNQIGKLGTVELTEEFLNRLTGAEAAFAALSAAQQAQVTNSEKLTLARTAYEGLKADKDAIDPVEDLIAAIPDPVAADSIAAIRAAENAYDALTPARQLKVANAAKLFAARTAYDALLEELDAIGAVEAYITAIGTVEMTDDSYKSLIQAELAYNALSDEMKASVSNVQTLLDARTAFDSLKAERLTPTGESGSGISYVTIRVTPAQNLIFSQTQDDQQFSFGVSIKARKNSSINYGWMVQEKLTDEERLLPIGRDYSLGWGEDGNRDFNAGLGTGDTVWDGTIRFTAEGAAEYNTGVGIAVDVGATSWGKSVKKATLGIHVIVLDKRPLLNKLTEIQALDTANWTDGSKRALNAAVQLANLVKEDNGATSQVQVDAALNAVTEAVQNAKLRTADYTALDSVIRAAKQLNAANYKDFSAVEAALASAEALDRNLDASQQAQVTAVLNALTSAVGSLEMIPADYTELDAVLEQANGLNPDHYLDFSAVQAAIDAVNRDLGISDQAKVDAMAAAIREAMNQLQAKPGDYSKLNELLKKIDAMDQSLYVDFSGVNEALFDVIMGLDILHQEEINRITANLQKQVDELVYKDADYTAVDAALADVDKLNKNLYKDFSAVEAAVNAVVRGKNITEQEAVTAMAKAINEAVAALVYKDADYSAVDKAIADANKLDKALYKDFSAVEAAVNAVVRGKNITEQEAVTAMAKAINEAVAALVYKDADYSAVDKAIDAANKLDKALYKDFSAVEAAVNAVVRGKNITEQEAVTAMAKAIDEAVAALVYKDADYTAVDNAILAAGELNKEHYVDFSAVEAAIAAVVRDKNITEQSSVDAMEKAIRDAMAALEFKPADYSKVEEALEAAEQLDPSLYANYDEVLAAIEAVKRDYNISQQDDVDAMAAAIQTALEGLAYKAADYSRVEELKAKAEALNAGDYVDFSKVQAALDAIDMSKNITEQSEVDAMAQALEDAINALERKPNESDSSDPSNPSDNGDGLVQTGDSHFAGMLALGGLSAGLFLLMRKKKFEENA